MQIKLKQQTALTNPNGRGIVLLQKGAAVKYEACVVGPVTVHIVWVYVDNVLYLTEKVCLG